MDKSKILLIGIALLVIASKGFSQDSTWVRTYEFGFYSSYDLRNSSTNAVSTHRALNDGFKSLVVSKMNPKAGNISRGIFAFATTYLTMIWSHEFGHSIRAKQVGGTFNIHNFGLPIPYTTADLPANISLENRAIFVTGGFEVNCLNTRKIQSDFLRQNGIWSEDLSFSFANRLMYPIYTTLIVPIDATDRNVWIETAGDPVHYILPVFENYSNNQVFMPDSTVNPELASLYNQAAILGLAFNLLDPQFYRELGATFGNAAKIRKPIFMVGDHITGWTYGTRFNASPLGYELYMQNYIHLNNKQFGLYVRYGQPYKNLGVGISMNDIFTYRNFKTDFLMEMWQQDLYGNGISAEFNGQWKVSKRVGVTFNLGYKTKGYVLGKQLNSGLNLGAGVCFYNDKN